MVIIPTLDAEVVELFSLDRISVFYVDYGNPGTLMIDQLRYWDDYLPFLAVHRRIANIKPLKQNHPEAIDQFRRVVLDRGVKIHLLDNQSPWEIQRANSWAWEAGTVIERIGRANYDIFLDDRRRLIRAHANQLKNRVSKIAAPPEPTPQQIDLLRRFCTRTCSASVDSFSSGRPLPPPNRFL
ncbi:conserved hypothetical protein [Culex quinquefasciatus]|uniref:Uncharacterized protein n=1 Tax=Culex quinquefasciatus TaxID=7176 RepID=B0X087_CULQU|nr:conserved hypothetical protein [Culex quinquefasciatus]|eukprot:XP_001863059.1 conserved hypothetical protein [Culex quinquefasciatus]